MKPVTGMAAAFAYHSTLAPGRVLTPVHPIIGVTIDQDNELHMVVVDSTGEPSLVDDVARLMKAARVVDFAPATEAHHAELTGLAKATLEDNGPLE